MERVRAIIIKEGRILLIKRVKKGDSYWVVPGGGVESGEDHERAILRECHEELGVNVSMGDFFCDKVSEKPQIFGQREFFYNCSIVGGKVGNGNGPEFYDDKAYEGEHIVEWVELKNLPEVDLRPAIIKEKIIEKYLH